MVIKMSYGPGDMPTDRPFYITPGCAYTVDSEGEFYYAPRYVGGYFNIEEFDIVDFDTMAEEEIPDIKAVHEKLCDWMENKSEEWFRNANK